MGLLQVNLVPQLPDVFNIERIGEPGDKVNCTGIVLLNAFLIAIYGIVHIKNGICILYVYSWLNFCGF